MEMSGKMPVSPVVFHNHFENTVSPYGWSGVRVDAPASLTVDQSRPHHGAYNLVATVPKDAAPTKNAYVYYTVVGATSHDHWFCRVMNLVINALADADRQYVFYLSQDIVGVLVCSYGFLNDGGVLKPVIYYRHAGAFAEARGNALQLNTPYCMEIEILQSSTGNTDGLARLWIDGKKEIEVLNLDNDDRAINYVHFGLRITGYTPTVDNIVRGDCFVLSKMPIGCETAVRNCMGRGADLRRKSDLLSVKRSGTRMHLH